MNLSILPAPGALCGEHYIYLDGNRSNPIGMISRMGRPSSEWRVQIYGRDGASLELVRAVVVAIDAFAASQEGK